MKPLTIFLILFSLRANAQNISAFNSNTSPEERANSLVLHKFQNKYDEIISFTWKCYWPKEQWYYLLGHKESGWEAVRLTVKFKDRDKAHPVRMKIKRRHISNLSVDSLLTYWTQNGFWNLADDSLNCFTYKLNDSVTISGTRTDGCSNNFEIITKDKYYIADSYEPDYNQKDMPVVQRAKFILCRDRFFRLVPRKKKHPRQFF